MSNSGEQNSANTGAAWMSSEQFQRSVTLAQGVVGLCLMVASILGMGLAFQARLLSMESNHAQVKTWQQEHSEFTRTRNAILDANLKEINDKMSTACERLARVEARMTR